MELRVVVSYAFCWLGVVLVVAQSWCIVHDLMQPYKDGVQVQHGVDPVEDVEHQLALLPDGTSVGVYGAGIIPVLQKMH